ncbi:hypothetical protein Patl1_00226 [Pistacia atlantica]|uniref:Uncharacterized protein n=1 Tax=Pistacia atlantica TaxID=434234 RepID=A0ACC1C541_9ROSI|nr:hypothetical protein Patl1_00226 [Pistacia atlantica]
MPEIMDGSSAITTTTTAKPPQISEMFQKFALAFKTKTFEFFADEDDHDPSDSEGFALLDSTEDFITDQKVVVIKPDRPHNLRELSPPKSPNLGAKVTETQLVKSEQTHKKSFVNIQMTHTLISSVFATVSSFEASYLQLQTAHVPDFCKSPDFVDSEEDLAIGSRLEHQVQENQSKLRTLGTVSDRLQEEIDQKDSQVAALRKQLGEIRNSNSKTTHKFTKILIDLMRIAGWDLDLATNYVYHDIDYVKKGHNRYAFLSYVCLGMFRGFDLEGFGFCENDIMCNGHNSESGKSTTSLKQLLEHVSCNPLEMITRDHKCEFSKFCERKYQELIHPTMESSIFSNLDQNEVVLSSWRSLSEFYESFVSMASSIWTLHKLAFSFDPVVEIFQVERGVDFSMVYMEDVTRRSSLMGKARAKVGFTVVPGFKVGRTVIQSQEKGKRGFDSGSRFWFESLHYNLLGWGFPGNHSDT